SRRRTLQIEYNREHGITPQTIKKPVREQEIELTKGKPIPRSSLPAMIIDLESLMKTAAQQLNFEEAIMLRDRIAVLKKELE
ncbi:MAG: UvrB/UvrC motif-containing protein, partial [Methanobacteriota archaeon]